MVGSLCNLRELIRRVQVDKTAKTFSVCDEFVVHVFKGCYIAAICNVLNIKSPTAAIECSASSHWLRCTAEKVVTATLFPDGEKPFSRSFLHTLFLYTDLRHAIRFEDGEHIIRHWRWWLPRFLATGKKNYSLEAATLLLNITADFPKHISYIVVHNRTVNMSGQPG